ncbi:unnamed protein product [Sphagnum jensenii]|uniref:Uncharacterized protein n=1 Tax=Sphagnum jensenii TaxID=128206 RepID=A0ABP0W958_9BRYO
MATRVRAQNSTAVPRHEAQIPGTHRGGEASKPSRSQASAPPTRKDLAKTRSGSPSSDPEQRSTSAGAPDNRMAIDPTPSPCRAEGETRADDKKPPVGATTPRNSIFFELPGSDCPKAQNTDSGTSALSIQNKRHLHWKVLDVKTSMGNEMEFSAPAHSLLMKTEAVQSKHQETKNRTANFQASPQAARKKRYTKLNFAALALTEAKEESDPGRVGEEGDPLENLEAADVRETGLFGPKSTWNRLNYA